MKLFDVLRSVFIQQENINPFALKGDLRPYKKRVVKNLKLFFAQDKYKDIFTDDFLKTVYSCFMKKGKFPKITEDSVNGTNLNHVRGILYHAGSLCSARADAELSILRLQKAEAEKVRLEVSREGKGCLKTPEEQLYSPYGNIPLYPCLDCECDPRCLVWYKGEW